MKNLTTTLKNPYYFIEDDDQGNKCLYKISFTQDADQCGRKLVVFDENGKVDEAASSQIFPYVKVQYKETEDGEAKNKYYWLTEFIEVGDIFDGVKFKANSKHSVEGSEGSYVALYKKQLGAVIADLVEDASSLKKVKSAMPSFLFAEEGDQITIDGKKVLLVSVTTSENEATKYFKDGNKTYYSTGNERSFNGITYFEWESVEDGTIKYTRSTPQDVKIGEMLYVWFEDAGVEEMIEDTHSIDNVVMTQDMYISDDDIMNYFYELCDKKTKAYANRLLKKFNRSLKDDIVIVTEENLKVGNWKLSVVDTGLCRYTIDTSGVEDLDNVPDGTQITITISAVGAHYTVTVLANDTELTKSNSPSLGDSYLFNIHEDTVLRIKATYVGEQLPEVHEGEHGGATHDSNGTSLETNIPDTGETRP